MIKKSSAGIFTRGKYHTGSGQEKYVKKLPDEWHSLLRSDWSHSRHWQNGLRHEGRDPGPRRPAAQAAPGSPQHWRLSARLQVCNTPSTHFEPQFSDTLQILDHIFYHNILFFYVFIIVKTSHLNHSMVKKQKPIQNLERLKNVKSMWIWKFEI